MTVGVFVLLALVLGACVVTILTRRRLVVRMRRIVEKHYGGFGKAVATGMTPALVVVGAVTLTAGIVLTVLRSSGVW